MARLTAALAERDSRIARLERVAEAVLNGSTACNYTCGECARCLAILAVNKRYTALDGGGA